VTYLYSSNHCAKVFIFIFTNITKKGEMQAMKLNLGISGADFNANVLLNEIAASFEVLPKKIEGMSDPFLRHSQQNKKISFVLILTESNGCLLIRGYGFVTVV
jgi:hypothetical protein